MKEFNFNTILIILAMTVNLVIIAELKEENIKKECIFLGGIIADTYGFKEE